MIVIKQITKVQLYRKRIREGQRATLTSYSNELHDALLNKNGPQFWRCWKSKFNSSTKCDQVDGCVDNGLIADKFADKFAEIYSSNNSQHATVLEREYKQMRSQYCGAPLTDDYLFDSEIVANVFAKLKRGKAPGLDTLSAEHLLHSHPALSCLLSKLFNLMLNCGHVPPQSGHSYTVPIPKLHDCRTKAITTEDFRGIAISPILSKVFEHCVIHRFENFFITTENQFGFKKGLSCNHAIFTVRSIVDRFVKNCSTINLCALDLSKAYDKVNHHALLIKLMKRQLKLSLH